MSAFPPEILALAVEAARRALRDMEDDEVPSRLRPVARSSDRKLTPPATARLIAELEKSEWLRDRAMDQWPEADPEDPDSRAAASALFLGRPEGWESRMSALAAAAREEAAAREAGALRRRIEELEAIVVELEARLGEAVRNAERRVAERTAAAEERAARVAKRLAAVEGELERERRGAGAEQARAARLASELAEADRRIDELRALVARERSRRGEGPSGDSWSWARARPADLGRMLDQMQAALSMAPVERGREQTPSPPFALPAGIRPDRLEAVDWLAALEVPTTLLVDGYNAVHHLGMEPDATGRAALEHGLARLRRLATGTVTVSVFYDSAQETPGAPGPVETRFVTDADEAVRQAARQVAGRVVVVSSDREVREGSEEAGAVCLWSEALAAWLRRGGG